LAQGWTEARDFSLFHSVQTGRGAHPASYTMGAGAVSPGHEADQSSPSSAEVKNGGNTYTLPYVFIAWCLINLAQG
jgi:hypothetical protein